MESKSSRAKTSWRLWSCTATKRPLVWFDEKSVQLLAHITQVLGMKSGQAAGQDYEYKRNGTPNLFLFVEPKAGKKQKRTEWTGYGIGCAFTSPRLTALGLTWLKLNSVF